MVKDTRRQAIRRANLALLLVDPQIGGPTALANLLGKPVLKHYFSPIMKAKRGLGDQLAKEIEDVTGKPPGWMDEQHLVAGEPPPAYAIAHHSSYPGGLDDLPHLPWEALMSRTTVPDLFRTVLEDDALAPDMPRGTEVVWTTRRRVAPGRIVLLRDAHKQIHARICHQGRAPGHWTGTANNPAYVSLSSDEPGFEVLAVYKGRLEPDDD